MLLASNADTAVAYLFYASVYSLISASLRLNGRDTQRASCQVQGRL